MGFEGSSPRIYDTMVLGGEMLEKANNDVISALSPFGKHGFVWRNGSLVRDTVKMADGFHTPWCHAKHCPGTHCSLDHQIIFDSYHIIHPRCMSCWKTVVTPKNFDELMIWYNIQNHGEINFAGKCGIELRDYTPKFYGAYHYARSLEEGREQYEVVKKLAKKYLSKKTAEGVLLKRACTEFEMIKGPSHSWHLTVKDEKIIEMIDQYVAFPLVNTDQNKIIAHPHVQLRWLLWAHANGDMSYKKYNGGETLFPGYIKYHEGDIAGIKHDMTIFTAQAKHNHDPNMTNDFLKSLTDYSNANKVSLDQIGTALGYYKKPDEGKVNYTDLYEVDEKVIGEGDALPEEE